MTRAHLTLAVAILAEVMATSALKASEGFRRPGPTVLVVVGYGLAFWCLSQTLESIPLGIVYALWSGLGVALITLVGWLLYGQRLDGAAVLGIALIIAGAVVLQLFSRSRTH
jgi:small multidrug resistance pump